MRSLTVNDSLTVIDPVVSLHSRRTDRQTECGSRCVFQIFSACVTTWVTDRWSWIVPHIPHQENRESLSADTILYNGSVWTLPNVTTSVTSTPGLRRKRSTGICPRSIFFYFVHRTVGKQNGAVAVLYYVWSIPRTFYIYMEVRKYVMWLFTYMVNNTTRWWMLKLHCDVIQVWFAMYLLHSW